MKINYKSDFDFILDLKDSQGESIGWPLCDFCIELTTVRGMRGYRAYCIGGETLHCFNDNGRLHVVCDHHGLAPGQVVARVTLHNPSAMYPDGLQDLCLPIETGIELVTGLTEVPVDGVVEVSLPVLVKTAYEMAVAAGYTGTEAEYTAAVASLVETVAAARQATSDAGSAASDARRAAEEAVTTAAEAAAQAETTASAAASQAVTTASEAAALAETSAASASEAATAALAAAESADGEAQRLSGLYDSVSTEWTAKKQEIDTAVTEAASAETAADRAASDANTAATAATAKVGEMAQAMERYGAQTTQALSDIQAATEQAGSATAAAEQSALDADAAAGRALDAASNTEILARDLAQYAEEEPITLVAGQANKAVASTGAIETRTGYAVSEPVRLRKGYVYLYRPSNGQPVAAGVALCARKVVTDTPVAIEYTYTYDEQGRIATATAVHDPGAVYTYTYDAFSRPVITDGEGVAVDELPAYRVAAADSYVPMFTSLSDTMPKSGYYAVLCPEDCEAVWSATTPSGEVLVVSYGVVRSIANQKADKVAVSLLEQENRELRERLDEAEHQREVYIHDMAKQVYAGQSGVYVLIKAGGQWDATHKASATHDTWMWVPGNHTLQHKADVKAIAYWSKAESGTATSLSHVGYQCHALENIYCSADWDLSECTNLENFAYSTNLRYLDARWDTSKVQSVSGFCGGCSKLEKVVGIEDWDTSSVTNMSSFLRGAAIEGELDLSRWDTSSVTDMSGFLSGAAIEGELDLSRWDTTNVAASKYVCTNMPELKKFVLHGIRIESSNNGTEYLLHGNAKIEYIDASGWDVSTITRFVACFGKNTRLKYLNITGWDTSRATFMSNYFFCNLSELEMVDGYFDFSSLTTLGDSGFGGPKIRKFEIRNFGAQESLSRFPQFRYMASWGSGEPESRQSLINTLIVYSHDRAAAGMVPATIQLHADVKARLTDEEKAAITLKGYTIS